MRSRIVIIAIAAFLVSGCANMTTTEQRTLSGAGMGAVGGVAIAAIAESSLITGTAIGAGVGAGAGYLYSISRNRQQHTSENSTKSHYRAARAAKRSKPENPNPDRVPDQRLASS